MGKDKIGIVGVGRVGASIAYSLILNGLPEELVLIDVDRERAEGEAMDLNHAMPYLPPCDIFAGDYKDLENAHLIIISAGAPRKSNESRMDLASRNMDIAENIAASIKRINNATILVVANPVDILTTFYSKTLDSENRGRVLGSGTALDTARLRINIAAELGVDPRNVHAYILGEHGGSQVPLFSCANVGQIKINEYPSSSEPIIDEDRKNRIYENTVRGGAEIIRKKGATHFGIAQAATYISEAVIRDQKTVLCVSSIPEGEYGIYDTALSMPSITGIKGVEGRITPLLTDEERKAFNRSAEKLGTTCKKLGII